MSIDEASLSASPINDGINPDLIKQAYVRYHGNLRQGSARNLTRGEVAYSTRKIYKQKGTGRARHGARKAPIFRGGGVTFAKTRGREAFRADMPVKMRRKANRNALLAKLLDSEVKVIDNLRLDSPKTKAMTDLLSGLGVDRKSLLATSMDAEKARNVVLSGRNVEDLRVVRLDQLTVFEMLNHRYLIVGREELEAWLSGPTAQTDKSAKQDPQGRQEKKARRVAVPRGKRRAEAGAGGEA